jgi:poly-D-alanine transfer protein DltD
MIGQGHVQILLHNMAVLTVLDQMQNERIVIFTIVRWFSPGTPVSSTNKTDLHDITEILVESGVKHHNTYPLP